MIKRGVKLYGLRPEMCLAHTEIADVFQRYGIACIITSGIRKKYTLGSFHPIGFALDYRTKHIVGASNKKHRLLASLKLSVPQCDFILENEGKSEEHLHAEFDPKDDLVFQADKQLYKATNTWPDSWDKELTKGK